MRKAMPLRYEFGIRLAFVRPPENRSWPDLLFDAMKQLQELSLVDLKLRDVLRPGEDYPWPGDPPSGGEHVFHVENPDVMGPLPATESRALLGALDAVGRSGTFDHAGRYARGALVVPGIQAAGKLHGGFLDGIWCMPLGVLTTLAGDTRGGALQDACVRTLFPIAIAPT